MSCGWHIQMTQTVNLSMLSKDVKETGGLSVTHIAKVGS